jgi:hypothetical protein
MRCSLGRGIKTDTTFDAMTLSELAPETLAAAYLNGRQRLVLEDGEHDPLWLWEAWIADDPEKAWQVLELLLRNNNDDDALEQIVYRIHQFLVAHWGEFHERVKTIVNEHKELPRFIPEGSIVKERYIKRTFTNEEIINAYLENHRQLNEVSRLEFLIANEPEQAWPIVLEIINRGQLYRFDSFDLLSPLRDLLERHLTTVIERLENAAQSSVMLRRCLWRMQRHIDKGSAEYLAKEQIWQRAFGAAGNTNDYNSSLPEIVVKNDLTGDGEQLLSAWFTHRQTFWFFDEIWEITGSDSERLWEVIKAMIVAAPNEDELAYIGAGPIEDLLSGYGDEFIDRIEHYAETNEKFRFALSCAYKSGSDEVWQRVISALGEHPPT